MSKKGLTPPSRCDILGIEVQIMSNEIEATVTITFTVKASGSEDVNALDGALNAEAQRIKQHCEDVTPRFQPADGIQVSSAFAGMNVR